MNVKLLGDKVLVQLDKEEEMTRGGIIIAETARKKPDMGTVIAVGTGAVTERGVVIEPGVKPGDKVMLTKNAGVKVTIDNKEMLVVEEKEILGVLA